METIFVSDATITRDLSSLEHRGILKRVHGGAILIKSPAIIDSFLVREQVLVKEKKRIALKSLDFIKDGYSIFIDPSTTVGHIIPLLNQFNDLSIVTNGIHTALMLMKNTNFKVVLTSGEVNPITSSTTGTDTNKYIKQFNCNLFIFSCSGISLNNAITEANLEQMNAKKTMLEQSAKHILLVDHTKFDKTYFTKVCDFNEVDIIITDKDPNKEYIKVFNDNGIELIIADSALKEI